MIKLLLVIGTRPEAIKMSPIAFHLKNKSKFDYRIVMTGQHKEMASDVLKEFNIDYHYDLNLMKMDQTLNDLAGDIFQAIQKVLVDYAPDMVLVQGDTTTTLVAATASFYMQIPVGHIEAGLRTLNKKRPFPEEMNRRLVTQIADLHFTPTEKSRSNLLKEGIDPECVTVTGNTVIDALKIITSNTESDFKTSNFVLITCHRRDNYDAGINTICQSIRNLAGIYPDITFVYVTHPNPNFRKVVFRSLDKISNVTLIDPQPYNKFLQMMLHCRFVITDSGGIQEEAYSMGIPLIILREETERPEVLDSDNVFLVGTDRDKLYKAFDKLAQIKNPPLFENTLNKTFGIGNASHLIIDKISNYFRKNS